MPELLTELKALKDALSSSRPKRKKQPPTPKEVLTVRRLKALAPAAPGKRDMIWDAALPSFGVRVTDKGSAAFVVMRRLKGGKLIRRTIGFAWQVPLRGPKELPFPLAEARAQAREILVEMSKGIDPKEKRRAQIKAERIIHPENKDVLVRAMLRLEISFEELAKHFIEPNLPAKSHHAEYGYETIWELMQASFVIGSIARPTDPAKEFFKHEHAEEMRAAKGAKSAPAKTALINAVVAVRGAGPPAPTAWKEAECILDPVNRQLKSVGFEHVKGDKIRRVLEKPLRS